MDLARWRRRFTGCFALIGVVAFIAIVFVVVLTKRTRSELDKIRGEIAAREFPLTLGDIETMREWVPDDVNAARIYIAAAARFIPPSEEENEHVYKVAGPHVRDKSPTLGAEHITVLKRHLSANLDALRLAHDAAALPAARYSWETVLRNGEPSPSSQTADDTTRIPQLLIVEGIVAAHESDSALATKAFIDAFAYVRSWGGVPTLDNQLWRVVLFRDVVDNVVRAISEGAIKAADFPGILEAAVQSLVPDPGRLALSSQAAVLLDPDLVPYGTWLDVDTRSHLRAVRILRNSIEAYENGPRSFHLEWNRESEAHRQEFEDYFNILPKKASYPSWHPSLNMMVNAHVYLELLRALIAIEQWRGEHGDTPERLASLVPKYLTVVPQDPYGEGTIRYRRDPNGYAVYSVYLDHDDDLGAQTENWNDGDEALVVERLVTEIANTER